jgi:HEAT repeat protein
MLLLLGGCSWDQSPSSTMAGWIGLGGQSSAELAADAFDLEDPDKRRRSIIAIANGPHGDKTPYRRLYRKLTTDPDPTVRAACARALGMHGHVPGATTLAELLDDESTFVRWEAAKALQRIHNPAVTQPLIDTLQEDDDADVRMAAAHALGQYAQPAVVDALITGLRDQNYGVVQQTRDSLRTLTGHPGPANAADWLRWVEAHRGELFAQQQRYTYQPYHGPPNWLDRATFWSESGPRQRIPRGMPDAESDDASPSSP